MSVGANGCEWVRDIVLSQPGTRAISLPPCRHCAVGHSYGDSLTITTLFPFALSMPVLWVQVAADGVVERILPRRQLPRRHLPNLECSASVWPSCTLTIMHTLSISHAAIPFHTYLLPLWSTYIYPPLATSWSLQPPRCDHYRPTNVTKEVFFMRVVHTGETPRILKEIAALQGQGGIYFVGDLFR
jgi:hypothetical protein